MVRVGDLVLAVDTSTQVASVALYDGISVQAEMTWKAPRRHTMELVPQVVSMLEQLHASASALTGLVVALGPGSFTGLRIGLALIKGLALARAIPMVGIPTLDVTAYPVCYNRATLYATLQAGRGRICVAPYRWRRGRWRRSGDVTITTWEALAAEVEEGAVFCGEIDTSGLEALKRRKAQTSIATAAQRIRRAGYLAELGWDRLRRDEPDDPATLQPIYVHTV
jgi:tRNA threonylcarbamoyladenosine biosynthesis protein TsaB